MHMNIQTMLLPHKHIRFCSSLVAIAGHLRQLIREPRTLDELWAMIESDRSNKIIRPTFTQLVLAVDILFAIKQAQPGIDGRISLIKTDDMPGEDLNFRLDESSKES
ncbi:ABC-three component system middle component 6 [Pseudomonas aeruginosa]|uniref:ABC-three component system middle component 6 n=2 Tax=Pseudomonadaceae TaxID=135621 RepID=UPI0006912F0B